MCSVVNRTLSGLLAVLVVGMLAASPAGANGPCGEDFDGNQACGVNSPGTYGGSLTTDNERDYYVLYAQQGTQLSASITDTENPGCFPAPWPTQCGNVRVELDNANGDALGEDTSSMINNGITVTGTFSHTLEATETYYLIVSGGLGDDANSNPTPVPYTLSISASPAVQWPPPAPAQPKAPPTAIQPLPQCHVPKLIGLTLATARARLTRAHCELGAVEHVGHRRPRHQRVIGQSLTAGSVYSHGTRVSVTLR